VAAASVRDHPIERALKTFSGVFAGDVCPRTIADLSVLLGLAQLREQAGDCVGQRGSSGRFRWFGAGSQRQACRCERRERTR
jgi:hypothetical protein